MRQNIGGHSSQIFQLDHMRINDMRAKEELHVGDMVRVDSGESHKIDARVIHGKILAFDCDNRCAKLETLTGYQGWWYVKDLRLIHDDQTVVAPLPAAARNTGTCSQCKCDKI